MDLIRHIAKIPGVCSLWRKMPIGSVSSRVRFGIWDRPHYGYGVWAAAQLAKKLELPGITAIEFGVAGGKGLLALEHIAQAVESDTGIKVAVMGFDSGQGMPPPRDYRDLPYIWGEGDYRMDEEGLRAQLKRAGLVIGDVRDTIPKYFAGLKYPIGFIAFDLDYYSSTRDAFAIFDGAAKTRLPRIYCYFDDTIWPEDACHNSYIGELAAIRDFNAEQEMFKIAPLENLRWMREKPSAWNEQMYVLHHFSHPLYTRNIRPSGEKFRQKPLVQNKRYATGR